MYPRFWKNRKKSSSTEGGRSGAEWAFIGYGSNPHRKRMGGNHCCGRYQGTPHDTPGAKSYHEPDCTKQKSAQLKESTIETQLRAKAVSVA